MSPSGGFRVEFTDGSPEPPEPPEAPAAARPAAAPASARALVPPLLWVVAAGLCVLATFQNLFTYRFYGAPITSRGGYDAWGNSLDRTLSSNRGPSYAVLFWICAGTFALLAVALLSAGVTGWVRGLARRHTVGIAIGVAALLAGVLAAVVLELQANFASYHALSDTIQDKGSGVHMVVGGCLWFGIAALIVAVAAAVTMARARAGIEGATPEAPRCRHTLQG